jgi:hypothetical protein
MIQPQYERDTAKRIHATATILTAAHVPMLSMPGKVADVPLRSRQQMLEGTKDLSSKVKPVFNGTGS